MFAHRFQDVKSSDPRSSAALLFPPTWVFLAGQQELRARKGPGRHACRSPLGACASLLVHPPARALQWEGNFPSISLGPPGGACASRIAEEIALITCRGSGWWLSELPASAHRRCILRLNKKGGRAGSRAGWRAAPGASRNFLACPSHLPAWETPRG